MGLNKSANEGMIFLSVANGKLVREHKEKNEVTAERVNKKGRTVHEEFFKDLTGVITEISTRENDFGKQWQVIIVDGNDKFMVQMPYSGRYSSSFLKALPNVSQGEAIRFSPWEMQDKKDASRKITGVTMYQNDGNGWVKIPSAYTKEDPNGLPEMRKVKIKGKETWDDGDMMEFLEAMAKDWCKSINVNTGGQGSEADEPAPF